MPVYWAVKQWMMAISCLGTQHLDGRVTRSDQTWNLAEFLRALAESDNNHALGKNRENIHQFNSIQFIHTFIKNIYIMLSKVRIQ